MAEKHMLGVGVGRVVGLAEEPLGFEAVLSLGLVDDLHGVSIQKISQNQKSIIRNMLTSGTKSCTDFKIAYTDASITLASSRMASRILSMPPKTECTCKSKDLRQA